LPTDEYNTTAVNWRCDVKAKPGIDRAGAETLFRASEILEDHNDVRGAFRCVAIAAASSHGFSQIKLGYMYALGIGTKKDLKRAAHWYRLAYRNGHPIAAFNLAMDRKDQGDRKSAIVWFRKAVAQNYGDAFVALAKLYTERNATRRQALALLKRALRLSMEDISDDSREEAQALLRNMSKEK
jgi:tetratricopeptide (TPR) repeat protein